ncbi:hypothetical protein H5410_014815 [Solanum commersonii]|uniref:Uncharacterized protein n=1 Tax=Solanum commersonii TaxID=4109 RepID=A0A9J5ZSK5_SOLCO|nr:hypothetical protein H5410_014815 [Solanum commersonii]
MGLEIAFCSSVLSPEGKGQVSNEMEQSVASSLKQEGNEIDLKADRLVYRQSRLTAPIGPPLHKFSYTISTCLNF